MFSTPSYYDNPGDVIEYLKGLTKGEADIYVTGYTQACYQFIESIVDTKQRFLSATLETDDEDAKVRLIAHVKLLDMLEEVVATRIEALKN